MNNTSIFALSELAEASYANLLNPSDVRVALELQNSNFNNMSFSAEQAADFITRWSVLNHQPDTDNGFSATLFASKDASQANRYVLAIRGTAGVVVDLLGADGGDIVRDGLALDQIVDLYNYWQRLKSGAGQTYQAKALEIQTVETAAYQLARVGQFIPFLGLSAEAYLTILRARSDLVIDEPAGLVRRIVTVDSSELFSDDRRYGLGINVGAVTVVGHSLGGHLAAAFSRLFPSETTDVLMVNGAGFGDGLAISTSGNGTSNVEHLFAGLNGSANFNAASITNIVGSAGMDFVAQDWWIGLHQPGRVQTIQTESVRPATTFGHGAPQIDGQLGGLRFVFSGRSIHRRTRPCRCISYPSADFSAGSASATNTLESLV